MKNSAGRGECYPPRPKAEVDNTLRDLQNSSYPTKAEFNNCFIIHSNIFFTQTCTLYSWLFLSLLNDTTLCPGFLGLWFSTLWRQWFNNLQRATLLTSFWHQWFNNLQRTALLTSLVQYDRILGQQQLLMVNYACGFNQSETGKYFEWIIMSVLCCTLLYCAIGCRYTCRVLLKPRCQYGSLQVYMYMFQHNNFRI